MDDGVSSCRTRNASQQGSHLIVSRTSSRISANAIGLCRLSGEFHRNELIDKAVEKR